MKYLKTKNPNAPDKDGWTPLKKAARKGSVEIVKILAPLTDNPNAPYNVGKTPSSVTNNEEIREILEAFKTSNERKAGASGKPSKKRTKKF